MGEGEDGREETVVWNLPRDPGIEMMYGQWEKRIPLDEEGPRAKAIVKLAVEIHAVEHNGEEYEFGTCEEGWHTERWFSHIATQAFDSGSGGR